MVQQLRQSTARIVRMGPFVDVTDGFTPETGVTLAAADEAELLKANGVATVSIAANTWAAITGSDGWYNLSLTTTDTNTLGMVDIVVQDDSVCLPVHKSFEVVTANYWDSKFSTGVRSANVTQWLGTACATPTVAGVPKVDLSLMRGVAQSAIDLTDFADTGYDPSWHRVVTVNTTNIAASTTLVEGFSTSGRTQINSEVLDVLTVDTVAEMAQGAPPASPTMQQILNYLYRTFRNKSTTTATTKTVLDDAGTTELYKATLSDVSGTFTKDEYVTGV